MILINYTKLILGFSVKIFNTAFSFCKARFIFCIFRQLTDLELFNLKLLPRSQIVLILGINFKNSVENVCLTH